jgi:catechol 2,3-dioxygenase-like lactoylglutathione lyase family enzyme
VPFLHEDENMNATTAVPAAGLPGPPPKGLHHTGYVTHDAQRTTDFYTRVLRMELINIVVDDAIPSTGDPWPYIHLFFKLGDGSTIAFFECVGLPPPSAVSHPAYAVLTHFAMDAGSRSAVDAWAEHLRGCGVEFIGPVDHGIIYSIYFFDPDGNRLELTASTSDDWQMHQEEALADLRSWSHAKASAQQSGDLGELRAWIHQRRAKHKRHG